MRDCRSDLCHDHDDNTPPPLCPICHQRARYVAAGAARRTPLSPRQATTSPSWPTFARWPNPTRRPVRWRTSTQRRQWGICSSQAYTLIIQANLTCTRRLTRQLLPQRICLVRLPCYWHSNSHGRDGSPCPQSSVTGCLLRSSDGIKIATTTHHTEAVPWIISRPSRSRIGSFLAVPP